MCGCVSILSFDRVLIFQTSKLSRDVTNRPEKEDQLFRIPVVKSFKFSLTASKTLILVCPSVLWAGCGGRGGGRETLVFPAHPEVRGFKHFSGKQSCIDSICIRTQSPLVKLGSFNLWSNLSCSPGGKPS